MFNSYVIWLRSFFWFCRIFSHRQVLRSELTLQNFSIFFHSIQNSKKIITEKVKQNKMKRSTVVALCISAAGFCVVAAAFVYFVILTPQPKNDSHSDHTEVTTQWVKNNSNWNNLFVLLNLTNPVTFCYIWIRNHLNILFVKIEWYSSGWIATMHPKRWVNKRNHFFHQNQWRLTGNQENHFIKKNLMRLWTFRRKMSKILDGHRDTHIVQILCEIPDQVFYQSIFRLKRFV